MTKSIINKLSTVALFVIATLAVLFSSFSPVILNSVPETEEITIEELTEYTENALSSDASDAVNDLIGLCLDSIKFAEDLEDAVHSTEDLTLGGYAKAEYRMSK